MTLTRREFLFLSAAAGLGAALRPEAQPTPPDSLRFELGFHLLNPELIQPSTSIILGETGIESLLWYEALTSQDQLDAMVDELFPPSTSYVTPIATIVESPRRDILQHFSTLLQAKTQDTHFVVTDTAHWFTLDFAEIDYQLGDLYRNGSYRVAAAGLATIAAAGFAGLTLLRKNELAKSTKPGEAKPKLQPPDYALDLLAILSLVGTTVGATMILRLTQEDLVSRFSQQVRGVNVIAELGAKAYLPAWQFLTGLGNETAKQMVELVDLRSLTMALNTHLVQASLEQNSLLRQELMKRQKTDHLESLFYAGNGHLAAESLYALGAVTLESKVAEKARQFISFMQEQITAALSQPAAVNLADLNTSLKTWIILTGPFSYPIPSYVYLDQFQNGPSLFLPDSPRAILWRELMSALKASPTDLALQLMGQRLLREDMELIGPKEGQLQPLASLRQRLFHTDQNAAVYPLSKIPLSFHPALADTLVITEGIPFPAKLN